ncbi:hypothetical protein EA488_23770, partial [Salmonella enterica subsp. enterica serovar Minnesota]|nr:hypothetical protein [Salmonella enterica subsp. enterica serovar Minnesota]
GTCSPGGWLGAGSGDWQCTLPAGGNGAQTLSLQVAAQVVKTGENTPVLSARALQPENGDIQLQVNGSPVPLTGTGIIAPQLATPVTCSIASGEETTINFGSVHRNTDDEYHYKGNVLKSQTQNISIKCGPPPDDGASPYKVLLTFTGNTSDIYKTILARKGALITSIPDLFIILLNSVTGELLPISPADSTPILLSQDTTTGYYNLSVKWDLMGYSPKDSEVPDKSGPFSAMVTYTVDVS